jgi:hypothetical protein
MSLPVHSGTLNDAAILMAKIFFKQLKRYEVADRFVGQYTWTEDNPNSTFDIKGIDATGDNKGALTKPTCFAGCKTDIEFEHPRRVRDTETNEGTTYTTTGHTQLIFRLETFQPDDGRWIMGAMADYLFSMRDPFIKNFGGESGQISDYVVKRMLGPGRVSEGGAQPIWRTDILVDIRYHLTTTLLLESLPVNEIDLVSKNVD